MSELAKYCVELIVGLLIVFGVMSMRSAYIATIAAVPVEAAAQVQETEQ